MGESISTQQPSRPPRGGALIDQPALAVADARPARRGALVWQPSLERQRVLEVIGPLAVLRGPGGVSINDICQRAGITRETYDRHFADLDDCLVSAIEFALERLLVVVWSQMARPVLGGWPEQVRMAVGSLLVTIGADRRWMTVVVIDPLGEDFGIRVLHARQSFVQRLGELLLPPEVGEGSAGVVGTAGGLWEMIRLDLAGHARYPIEELAAAGVFVTLAPVVGQSDAIDHAMAARTEVVLAAAVAAGSKPQGLADDDGAVTELSAATLRYLADCPGASNVEIAEAVGVGHQSQISRHLRHLQRRGLVEVQRFGSCNAWCLTVPGWQVVDRLSGS